MRARVLIHAITAVFVLLIVGLVACVVASRARSRQSASMAYAYAEAQLQSHQRDAARLVADAQRRADEAIDRAGARALALQSPEIPTIELPPAPSAPVADMPTSPAVTQSDVAQDSEDSVFKPDVYPTPRAAMAALVPQVIAAIEDLPAGAADAPVRVDIRDSDALETLRKTGRERVAASAEPCLRQLPDALHERFPQLAIHRNDDTASSDREPRLAVEVSTKDVRSTRVSWSNSPCVSATMVIRISREHLTGPTTPPSKGASDANVTRLSAKFTDRAWADAPAEFPTGTWMVAATPHPVESLARAEDVAFERAAGALTPTIAERLGLVGAATDRIASQIKVALKRGDACVADRIAQSFQRPYGTVYVERLLLDASPQKVGDLARRISSVTRAETAVQTVQVEHARSTFGQLLGFMLVVLVLYWFLNAATKGYFTWQLRAGAVLLVLAGIAAIVVFAAYFTAGPRPMIVAR